MFFLCFFFLGGGGGLLNYTHYKLHFPCFVLVHAANIPCANFNDRESIYMQNLLSRHIQFFGEIREILRQISQYP